VGGNGEKGEGEGEAEESGKERDGKGVGGRGAESSQGRESSEGVASIASYHCKKSLASGKNLNPDAYECLYLT
jgi:hypothetical protein